MNRYDELSTSTKAFFLIAGFVPTIYAGWRSQSWLTGGVVFLGGFFLALIILQILGAACRRVNTHEGKIDLEGMNNCFIWPFLFSWPVGGAVVTWVVLKYDLMT